MTVTAGSTTAPRRLPQIEFPPGYDRGAILRDLQHSAVLEARWTEAGSARRVELTRESPLDFALIYLEEYFADQVSRETCFAEGHMEMMRRVARWQLLITETWGVVAPRRYGKSTTVSLAGVVWALAHGHRSFVAVFSYTAKQAWANHVGRIKQLLSGRTLASQLLLADYPHLRIVSSSNKRLVLAGGGCIVACGLAAFDLGLVEGADRPDLGIFDDMLPGTLTNADNVAAIKDTVTTVAFPMFAGHAVIVVTGTVFEPGDLADDIVRLATGQAPRSRDGGAWLTGRGAVCTYITPDWPQRWSRAELARRWATDPRTYALEMAPHLIDQAQVETYFTTALFERLTMGVYHPIRRVIFTDFATSGKAGVKGKHDESAIAVLAFTGRHVIVEWAEGGVHDLESLYQRCLELHGQFTAEGLLPPDTLGWESVAGGAQLAKSFRDIGPLPAGMTLKPFGVSLPKVVRIRDLHSRYVRSAVFHASRLTKYERQAISWAPGASGPGVDDMLDAVSAGVRELMDGDPGDLQLRGD